MTSPDAERLLPSEFSDLEPFVAYWASETTAARWQARCLASMEQIRAFYDAAIVRGEDALTYLEGLPIDALPPEAVFNLELPGLHGQTAC